MTRWIAVIIESHRIVDGMALDLAEQLERLTGSGVWRVQYVLPNGVNRWTVIASREEG